MKGIFGRYLEVNLGTGVFRDLEIPTSWYEKHLGGRGMGLRILLERLKPDTDPLGPDNILAFATGPLQGTGIAGGGRHVVISKSPKTGSLSESYAGGFFSYELARSGYDGILVSGRSDRPVYLALIEGKPEIRGAGGIWGLPVGDTEETLKARHPGARVTSIGPAGEKGVKFACLMNDMNRAAGRPGFGAVMGSKQLKAVVVKGSLKKPLHDEDMLAEVRKKLVSELMENTGVKTFGQWGSAGSVGFLNEMGILPTRNFQEGTFSGFDKIDGAGEAFRAILAGRDTCTGCPIRCKRVCKGEFAGRKIEERYGGPEYETCAAFGSYCLNSDIRAVALANQLCNHYGLDTISTGVTIAFAMEASEKGLIREKIDWGDPNAVVNLVEEIALRKGLGDTLANGIDTVAKSWNADFAMHIKGQEMPMHEARGKKSLAISYATSPRGAQHMEGFHDDAAEGLGKYVTPELGFYGPISRKSWDQKARFCKVYQDLGSFSNTLIACTYVGWDACLSSGYNPYPRFREAVYAITGLGLGVTEMLLIGERNYNLLKIGAALHGYTRKDDDLPERLKRALPRGNSADDPIPTETLQKSIDDYYELRGWDEWGPTREKLKSLGMEEWSSVFRKDSNPTPPRPKR
jgi:aldehyde:ferredoxin oxidoreductase